VTRRLLDPLIRAFGAPAAGFAVFALRLSGRRAGVVLLYHAVAEPRQPPELEIQPPHSPRLFGGQLRHVRRWYRVVEAAELFNAVTSRRRGARFPVAVTFDDDLPEHVSVALPILSHEQVPATFFLCGASLERPFAFWWERLQRAVDAGSAGVRDLVAGRAPGLPASPHVRELAETIEGMTPEDRDAVACDLGEIVGSDPESAGLRAAGICALVDGGMAIGFHTLRHAPLDALDDERLVEALTAGREPLEACAGHRLDTIAYPHGRADGRVADAARAAGYRVGFSADGLAAAPWDDLLLVPRVTPSYRSTGHFAIQLLLRLVAVRAQR
jgi:peptidoglycan/xylan/chitin deacetylase (PgdA/CDA1 family)